MPKKEDLLIYTDREAWKKRFLEKFHAQESLLDKYWMLYELHCSIAFCGDARDRLKLGSDLENENEEDRESIRKQMLTDEEKKNLIISDPDVYSELKPFFDQLSEEVDQEIKDELKSETDLFGLQKYLQLNSIFRVLINIDLAEEYDRLKNSDFLRIKTESGEMVDEENRDEKLAYCVTRMSMKELSFLAATSDALHLIGMQIDYDDYNLAGTVFKNFDQLKTMTFRQFLDHCMMCGISEEFYKHELKYNNIPYSDDRMMIDILKDFQKTTSAYKATHGDSPISDEALEKEVKNNLFELTLYKFHVINCKASGTEIATGVLTEEEKKKYQFGFQLMDDKRSFKTIGKWTDSDAPKLAMNQNWVENTNHLLTHINDFVADPGPVGMEKKKPILSRIAPLREKDKVDTYDGFIQNRIGINQFGLNLEAARENFAHVMAAAYLKSKEYPYNARLIHELAGALLMRDEIRTISSPKLIETMSSRLSVEAAMDEFVKKDKARKEEHDASIDKGLSLEKQEAKRYVDIDMVFKAVRVKALFLDALDDFKLQNKMKIKSGSRYMVSPEKIQKIQQQKLIDEFVINDTFCMFLRKMDKDTAISILNAYSREAKKHSDWPQMEEQSKALPNSLEEKVRDLELCKNPEAAQFLFDSMLKKVIHKPLNDKLLDDVLSRRNLLEGDLSSEAKRVSFSSEERISYLKKISPENAGEFEKVGEALREPSDDAKWLFQQMFDLPDVKKAYEQQIRRKYQQNEIIAEEDAIEPDVENSPEISQETKEKIMDISRTMAEYGINPYKTVFDMNQAYPLSQFRMIKMKKELEDKLSMIWTDEKDPEESIEKSKELLRIYEKYEEELNNYNTLLDQVEEAYEDSPVVPAGLSSANAAHSSVEHALRNKADAYLNGIFLIKATCESYGISLEEYLENPTKAIHSIFREVLKEKGIDGISKKLGFFAGYHKLFEGSRLDDAFASGNIENCINILFDPIIYLETGNEKKMAELLDQKEKLIKSVKSLAEKELNDAAIYRRMFERPDLKKYTEVQYQRAFEGMKYAFLEDVPLSRELFPIQHFDEKGNLIEDTYDYRRALVKENGFEEIVSHYEKLKTRFKISLGRNEIKFAVIEAMYDYLLAHPEAIGTSEYKKLEETAQKAAGELQVDYSSLIKSRLILETPEESYKKKMEEYRRETENLEDSEKRQDAFLNDQVVLFQKTCRDMVKSRADETDIQDMKNNIIVTVKSRIEDLKVAYLANKITETYLIERTKHLNALIKDPMSDVMKPPLFFGKQGTKEYTRDHQQLLRGMNPMSSSGDMDDADLSAGLPLAFRALMGEENIISDFRPEKYDKQFRRKSDKKDVNYNQYEADTMMEEQYEDVLNVLSEIYGDDSDRIIEDLQELTKFTEECIRRVEVCRHGSVKEIGILQIQGLLDIYQRALDYLDQLPVWDKDDEIAKKAKVVLNVLKANLIEDKTAFECFTFGPNGKAPFNHIVETSRERITSKEKIDFDQIRLEGNSVTQNHTDYIFAADSMDPAVLSWMADQMGNRFIVPEAFPGAFISAVEHKVLKGSRIAESQMDRISDKLNRFLNEPELMNSPYAFRSVAALQVLDYICGIKSRDLDEMMFRFDENGRLFHVAGAGTPDSFTTDKMSPLKLGVIGEDEAEEILKMKEEEFRFQMRRFGKNDQEIDAAWERVTRLKNEIRIGKETYKSIHEGILLKGTIRIIPKDKWNHYTLKSLAERSPLFMSLTKVKEKAQEIKKQREDEALMRQIDENNRIIEETSEEIRRLRESQYDKIIPLGDEEKESVAARIAEEMGKVEVPEDARSERPVKPSAFVLEEPEELKKMREEAQRKAAVRNAEGEKEEYSENQSGEEKSVSNEKEYDLSKVEVDLDDDFSLNNKSIIGEKNREDEKDSSDERDESEDRTLREEDFIGLDDMGMNRPDESNQTSKPNGFKPALPSFIKADFPAQGSFAEKFDAEGHLLVQFELFDKEEYTGELHLDHKSRLKYSLREMIDRKIHDYRNKGVEERWLEKLDAMYRFLDSEPRKINWQREVSRNLMMMGVGEDEAEVLGGIAGFRNMFNDVKEAADAILADYLKKTEEEHRADDEELANGRSKARFMVGDTVLEGYFEAKNVGTPFVASAAEEGEESEVMPEHNEARYITLLGNRVQNKTYTHVMDQNALLAYLSEKADSMYTAVYGASSRVFGHQQYDDLLSNVTAFKEMVNELRREAEVGNPLSESDLIMVLDLAKTAGKAGEIYVDYRTRKTGNSRPSDFEKRRVRAARTATELSDQIETRIRNNDLLKDFLKSPEICFSRRIRIRQEKLSSPEMTEALVRAQLASIIYLNALKKHVGSLAEKDQLVKLMLSDEFGQSVRELQMTEEFDNMMRGLPLEKLIRAAQKDGGEELYRLFFRYSVKEAKDVKTVEQEAFVPSQAAQNVNLNTTAANQLAFLNEMDFRSVSERLKSMISVENTLTFLQGTHPFETGNVTGEDWVKENFRRLYPEEIQKSLGRNGLRVSDLILIDGKTAGEIWGEKYSNLKDAALRETAIQAEILKAILSGEHEIRNKKYGFNEYGSLTQQGDTCLLIPKKDMKELIRTHELAQFGLLDMNKDLSDIKDVFIKDRYIHLFQNEPFLDGERQNPEKRQARLMKLAANQYGKRGANEVVLDVERKLEICMDLLTRADRDDLRLKKAFMELGRSAARFQEQYNNQHPNDRNSNQSNLGYYAGILKAKTADMIQFYRNITNRFNGSMIVNENKTLANASILDITGMFSSRFKGGIFAVYDEFTRNDEPVYPQVNEREGMAEKDLSEIDTHVNVQNVVSEGETPSDVLASNMKKEIARIKEVSHLQRKAVILLKGYTGGKGKFLLGRTTNPDQLLTGDFGKTPTADELARGFVIRDYLNRLDKKDISTIDANSIITDLKYKAIFDFAVEKMKNDRVFISFASIHPDNFYTGWKKAEASAEARRNALQAEHNSFFKLLPEVFFQRIAMPKADENPKDIVTVLVNGNERSYLTQDMMYERLGRIVLNQILADPKNKNVLMAVETGVLREEELLSKTAGLLRDRNILRVETARNENNELVTYRPNFDAMSVLDSIRNGTYCNMVKNRLVEHAKTTFDVQIGLKKQQMEIKEKLEQAKKRQEEEQARNTHGLVR